MSQEQDVLEEMEQGFALDDQETARPGQERQPEQALPAEPEATPATAPEATPAAMPESGPAMPPQETQTARQEQPETARLAEVPENLAAELENLRALNPAAADLAMEDSADGESLRRRLENYGADLALDRAEVVLERRQTAAADAQMRQEAVAAHNRRFMETLKSRNSAYFEMVTNKAREAEAAAYCKSVFAWIETLPYGEGKKLMDIAQSGRDANQVCDLLERYEREKGRPDAAGLMAVPGRGAPVMAAGIGDKNDLDAGWNLNPD